MYKKEIQVHISGNFHNSEERSIPLKKGMSLYYTLRNKGVNFSAPCAGNGTCGACKIRVLEGTLPVTSKDIQILDNEQIHEGWRLACQAYPTEDCKIFIPAEEFLAVTEYGASDGKISNENEDELYSIAIDLGTTTLAYELFDLKTEGTIRTLSSTNPQRIYGADVVSRMEQSDNGRRDMLKLCIRQGLKKDISTLMGDIDITKISSVAISGNTTMIHLLMGYCCEGLGKYPFQPVTLENIETDACELGIMDVPIPVFITGGISAYVGGDILAGIAAQKAVSGLYIDLGTNAEMVLFDGNGKIYVTSAPAGPAFEAANISCGVGSIEGAVSSMSIERGQQTLTTIGGKEPIGFCGSGILETVYELLKTGVMDESGLLSDAYFDAGYAVGKLKVTQQDIRQIQLAKSAVFSAIQILMRKAGVTSDSIDNVYLAGGFGYHLNVEKAIGIGLLPKEFSGKIQTVGNASLYGSKEILAGKIARQDLLNIKRVCEEVYLSNEEDFQNIFMENMNFNTK